MMTQISNQEKFQTDLGKSLSSFDKSVRAEFQHFIDNIEQDITEHLRRVQNAGMSELSVFQPFNPQVIILRNGQRISFQEWQKQNGLKDDRFSRYFSFSDRKLNRRDFQLSELLFPIVDEFRKRVKKPVRINSAYRSQEEQDDLRKRGFRAAKYSPHVQGMALDIDTVSKAETYAHVRILEQISKELDIKIRIGFRKYLKDGNTFIHFDVCPEYFAQGKPFHHLKHSEAWERQARW